MPRSEIPEVLRARGWHRIYEHPRVVRSLTKHFERAYYYRSDRTIFATRWLGTETLKYPGDMWIYQEIIHELRPGLVIETGSYKGGSALFFATVLDAVGSGAVISIDVAPSDGFPQHPRVRHLTGSSVSPEILEQVAVAVADAGTVLVILDADHSRDHVLAELRAYAQFVTPGSYLIAEDTNVNGHPVLPQHGPGPWEAVEAFLAESEEFEVDRERERFLLTAAPRGFLRRRRRRRE
jgi:cephalosporin hydroxylase